MRIAKPNQELARTYCSVNGYELLAFRADGFLYRTPAGTTKSLTWKAAAAVLGIEHLKKCYDDEKLTLEQRIARAVMDDVAGARKYDMQTMPDGRILFSVPAYSLVCRIMDDHYVHVQATYINPINGESHLSIDRKVKYQ